MKELLSNEEIDSLLELFRAESGAAESGAVRSEGFEGVESDGVPVSPLDLLKPNRFGRERLHLIERLFASTAKALAGVFAERLRTDVVCDCVSVEQVRFASWRRQMEGPVGIWTVALPPFNSPMLLTMTGGLLHAVVDRLLGGSGRVDRVHDGFTSAELAVAEALVDTLVERVTASFADVVALRPRIDGRSGNPATIQAMAPTDVALAVYFQISGEVLHGDLRLALAYQDLEPFLDRVPAARTDAGDAAIVADRGAIDRAVRDVSLGLSVVLGRTAITVRSLLALQPGDVMRLDRVAGDLLEGDIEGLTRLRGEVVRSGSARALRVSEVIKGNEDEEP